MLCQKQKVLRQYFILEPEEVHLLNTVPFVEYHCIDIDAARCPFHLLNPIVECRRGRSTLWGTAKTIMMERALQEQ